MIQARTVVAEIAGEEVARYYGRPPPSGFQKHTPRSPPTDNDYIREAAIQLRVGGLSLHDAMRCTFRLVD